MESIVNLLQMRRIIYIMPGGSMTLDFPGMVYSYATLRYLKADFANVILWLFAKMSSKPSAIGLSGIWGLSCRGKHQASFPSTKGMDGFAENRTFGTLQEWSRSNTTLYRPPKRRARNRHCCL